MPKAILKSTAKTEDLESTAIFISGNFTIFIGITISEKGQRPAVAPGPARASCGGKVIATARRFCFFGAMPKEVASPAMRRQVSE
jgi:hypothetical protein